MFYLSRIEHTLRLPPHLLSLRLEDAVRGELKKLFLDKVIANLGLCISVHSIQSIKDGFILPNDGHPTFRVEFTLIMFRPFVGEIIVAKLKESTANGLRLSLEFFDDIYVPVHLLPVPSHSVPDPGKRDRVMWIWKFPDSDEELVIDGIDQIKFQVHMSLEFFDDIYVPVHLLPVPSHSVPDPGKRDRVVWIWKFPDSDEELVIDGIDKIKFQVHSVNFPPIPIAQPEDSKPFAPMVVTGSIDFDGLGPVSWWVDAEDKDEEPEDP